MTLDAQDHRLDDEEDLLLSLAESAARAGLNKGTWQSYVSRKYAPPADDPDDTDTDGEPIVKYRRRPRWRASTVDAFRDNRPGQGRRTDLVRARSQQQERIAAELAEPLPESVPAMNDWLAASHRAVLAVAEALVDHREEVLQVAPRRDLVAEAIDAAGLHIQGRPSKALASAVTYAMGLLGSDTLARLPDDSEVRVVLVRHRRLRDEFNHIRDRR